MNKRNLTLVVLALSLIAAMSLSACAPAPKKANATDSPSSSAEVDPKESEEPKKELPADYEKGTMSAEGFESAYLNLKFTPPEDIIMATEEEAAEMMDFGADTIYTDEDKKTIDYAKATTVCEMMASSPTGVPNVNIMVEKLPLKNMTVDQYLTAVKQQLLASKDLPYTLSETTSAKTIGGVEFQKLDAKLDMGEAVILQELCVKIIGDRAVSVSITFDETSVDAKDALVNAFTPLK